MGFILMKKVVPAVYFAFLVFTAACEQFVSFNYENYGHLQGCGEKSA